MKMIKNAVTAIFRCKPVSLAAARSVTGVMALFILHGAVFGASSDSSDPTNAPVGVAESKVTDVSGGAEIRSQVGSVRDVLRQAARYQHLFSTGQVDDATAFVELMEEATVAYPDEAQLWYLLGVAHFNAAAAIALKGGDMMDAAPSYQKGSAAVEQALVLDPEHPEAIAVRAGTRLLMTNFARRPEVIAGLQQQAAAEMDRAVSINPDSKRARLQRAFSAPTLPHDLRNHVNEAADLDYLSEIAGRSLAGDYIRIMRGDLEAELGRFDSARSYYQRVGRSSTSARELAARRLTAIDGAGVSMDDIKALRAAAGAQCTMCHAE
jgi:tetratricopeptide (TPR) repeat protein